MTPHNGYPHGRRYRLTRSADRAARVATAAAVVVLLLTLLLLTMGG